MTKRTIRAIRAVTPTRDANQVLPAWEPPAPKDGLLTGVGRYLPTGYRATTLDDLRNSCGKYADAAVNEAEAQAMSVWKMNGAGGVDLGIPGAVVTVALMRCRASARLADGFPSITGRPDTHTLEELSPASADEARRVQAEVYAAWKSAGCPHLASAVQRVRQTIDVIIRREDALNREYAA